MRNRVNQWVQEGAIYVWRYRNINRARKGWHFTSNPMGCRSIRNLLDRMQGGEACYRTLRLGSVTEEIWRVPNFGVPKKDRFCTLRIEFSPECENLGLKAIENGDGDFGITTSDQKNAETWMFW